MHYTYSIIRADLPLHQQIVQSIHSALNAGKRFNQHTSVVLMSIPSENALIELAQKLDQHNIQYELFFEPDAFTHVKGYTSLTTEPLSCMQKRALFKNLKLYKGI